VFHVRHPLAASFRVYAAKSSSPAARTGPPCTPGHNTYSELTLGKTLEPGKLKLPQATKLGVVPHARPRQAGASTMSIFPRSDPNGVAMPPTPEKRTEL
jgi:hypothetical protein